MNDKDKFNRDFDNRVELRASKITSEVKNKIGKLDESLLHGDDGYRDFENLEVCRLVVLELITHVHEAQKAKNWNLRKDREVSYRSEEIIGNIYQFAKILDDF